MLNTKLLSAAFVLGVAAAQECPNSIELGSWGEEELIGSDLIFRHAVVLASNELESSILCGRLEYVGEGYVAVAVSPSGTMDNAEAVIGLPDANTVKKYSMTSSREVTEMPPEQQTPMSNEITQEDGRTVMSFAKYLNEPGGAEHAIDPNGKNTFLWAVGNDNSLGYHKTRGTFDLTFDSTLSPTAFATSREFSSLVRNARPICLVFLSKQWFISCAHHDVFFTRTPSSYPGG